MKRYFRFRKDFRCNWYGLLGAFDTRDLKEQEVCSVLSGKHKWHNISHEAKKYYCDVFIFESDGETEEYVKRLNETLRGSAYFVKKEDEYDTLEELCDCYSFRTETTRDYFVAQSWKKADKSRHIYGCILTDTGIIRIAEINDQGDLELL